MQLTNKAYNILKWIAQYVLPASGTLYFALATIWGLPYGEQIIGTITAIDIFFGVILGLSKSQYDKSSEDSSYGTLQIDTSDPDKNVYNLLVTGDLNELASKKVIMLNVDPDAKI